MSNEWIRIHRATQYVQRVMKIWKLVNSKSLWLFYPALVYMVYDVHRLLYNCGLYIGNRKVERIPAIQRCPVKRISFFGGVVFSTRYSAFVVQGSQDFWEQKKKTWKKKREKLPMEMPCKIRTVYRCLLSVPFFPPTYPVASVTNSFSTIFAAVVPFRFLPNKTGSSRFVIVVRNAHVVVARPGVRAKSRSGLCTPITPCMLRGYAFYVRTQTILFDIRRIITFVTIIIITFVM